MNDIQRNQLEDIIELLNKSSSIFMEYIRRFEISWSLADQEEAMVMLGEMTLLGEGFEKALNGSITGKELESMYELIPMSTVVYEELLINVSEWLKIDDKNREIKNN